MTVLSSDIIDNPVKKSQQQIAASP